MGRNSSKRSQNHFNSGNAEQNRMTRSLDELMQFEEFCEEIAPKLRTMLKQGKTAQEIYAWAQSMAAAKAVTLINARDPKVAIAAVKEVLDRGVGKAAENINLTTRYEDLSDEELEILLKSQRDAINEASEKH